MMASQDHVGIPPGVAYSRGSNAFDSRPRNLVADSFDAFEATVLRDRAQAKGLTYIAAPFRVNGDGQPHRCKEGALGRIWLPFDLDGARDGEAFNDLCLWLQRFRGFAYTTASHTPGEPRARIILEASRLVDRTEGQRACLAIERDLKAELGDDVAKFDRSVYRGEQPCFTPLTNAQTFRFEGAPVAVDAILSSAPQVEERPGIGERARAATEADPIMRHLIDNDMVKRELVEAGRFAVVCPCADAHTSESNETSTVYMLPNFGGVRYGKFHCLHQHCVGRTQREFIEALGLDATTVWKAQNGTWRDAGDAGLGEVPPHTASAPSADPAGELLKSDKGVVKACEHNVRILVAEAPQFTGLHFDDFLARPRIDKRDWTDADDLNALCWLQATQRVPGFTLAQTRNGCRAVANARRRDSLRAFVESLPPWDGVGRIGIAFVDAWGAHDNALIRTASRNFFIAMIARALRPGAQVDTLWTFEGPQGTRKSQSLRALGGDFHAEITATIGTTDFQRELRGIWIAEMSELDSMRGKEASTIKRLLSAPADRFVEKFEKHAMSYPRRAIAVATTNEASYWQDPTGARRLVPVPCGEIRVDLIAALRLQWLAEARRAFETGATWWEFPAGMADAQDDRQQVDPWEDVLRHAIARGRRHGVDGQAVVPWPDGWIPSAEILRDWLRLEPHQQGRGAGVRIGHVMRRLGYRPERRGKERERGWIADTQAGDDTGVSA